ncbi:uncharacterized protein BXZ73DRAFT_99217 [Epithele typhae]|uniref:uncharacterized protein n=1 Tax=Epithele typhae TaxID=378194 RepID=UPI0020081E4D|nr:uncharacterized protein BXZ73DRAFT_99217 [Epithele typhae]KAH9940226.1 hypothetical protein BXZ73DRAFT_99217 [Epithele typhae]
MHRNRRLVYIFLDDEGALRKIIGALVTRFGSATHAVLRQAIPDEVEEWGKIRVRNDGDTMRASLVGISQPVRMHLVPAGPVALDTAFPKRARAPLGQRRTQMSGHRRLRRRHPSSLSPTAEDVGDVNAGDAEAGDAKASDAEERDAEGWDEAE